MSIPDFMASMPDYTKLDVESLVRVRKTAEDPVRMSIFDVIQAITGQAPSNCKHTWDRLVASYPDAMFSTSSFKFEGQGQKETPVCTLEMMHQTCRLLLGKDAAYRRAGLEPPSRSSKPADGLYIIQYSTSRSAVKIGRSIDVNKRKRSLESGHNFFIEVAAVFPEKGYLEAVVHKRLEAKRSKIGAGIEWFDISVDSALKCITEVLRESEVAA
jgi:hypothetical protein